LTGPKGAQPAGNYTIETEEERLEGLSFPAYRRLRIAILLPARVCRMRRHRVKWAAVEQRREILAENEARQIGRAERQARPIAQDEPCPAIDGRRGRLPVHRHRD
jgi:hypothetical protein